MGVVKLESIVIVVILLFTGITRASEETDDAQTTALPYAGSC